MHNALWCTSNCPDISLNWANAPPALQSAALRLPPPVPPAVLKPELLNLKSAPALLSAKVPYHFNLICLPLIFSFKALFSWFFFSFFYHQGTEMRFFFFFFSIKKGVVFMTLLTFSRLLNLTSFIQLCLNLGEKHSFLFNAISPAHIHNVWFLILSQYSSVLCLLCIICKYKLWSPSLWLLSFFPFLSFFSVISLILMPRGDWMW